MIEKDIVQFLKEKFHANWQDSSRVENVWTPKGTVKKSMRKDPPISGYGESSSWSEVEDLMLGYCSVTGDECLGITSSTVRVLSSEDNWIWAEEPIEFTDIQSLVRAVNSCIQSIEDRYSKPEIDRISI